MIRETETKKIWIYELLTPLTNRNSGFSKWGTAIKEGKKYFIKEFLSPIMPDETSPLSQALREEKCLEAYQFYKEKSELYAAIRSADNGNIVYIRDFFSWQSHFYITTEFVETNGISWGFIHELPLEKIELILKVLVYSVSRLHEKKIIHGDLKPDNILIKETVDGFFTVKLIDFDSSMFEGSCLESNDDIQGDTVYLAPEAFLGIIGENCVLTTKVDIFALGIIFHQYLSGLFPFFSDEYDYLYEAVLDGAKYTISPDIPEKYRLLISKMLTRNPEERPNLNEVLCWITENEKIYRKDSDEKMVTGFSIPQMWGESKNIHVESDKVPQMKENTLSVKKTINQKGIKLSGNLSNLR